ncbi:MAG: SDR family oxidoreductase [Candidatus Aceula meridiana]|nr:SDR family oxidoreductase [Candidatus Aceula meridiana]
MNKNSKVILITGCSSGFGLRTAARLAATGHKVFATMRDLSKKDDLVGEVSLRGGKTKILKLDVTDVKSIEKVVSRIEENEGHIDVLINNAGYGIGGFFEDLEQEEIRAVMETNFFGVQNVTRAVIPLMRKAKKGLIINLSSIAGFCGFPGLGAYSASKWALEGFSESLFFELAPFGIHVCLIEPGTYKTKIFFENRKYAKKFFNSQSPYYETSQKFQKDVNDNVRIGAKDPEEIAILIESLIKSEGRPAFRNIPDQKTKLISLLKRFLPVRCYFWTVRFLLHFSSKK